MRNPGEYWDEIERVFAAALAAEESARTAVLDAQCGSRSDVRADVDALLAAHARAGDFIAPHTLSGDRVDVAIAGDHAPGTRIGAFRLLERIARGGMGEVYRAERVDGEFTQHVAIKLIAARLQGADTVPRFRAERQILASLQHPNVVTLVDGGVTANGQPFIVMEFVDGVAITEYCRRSAIPLDERLRLFQQVCGAVGFAHRHLVVHRDLKPGNVLVTGDGVVKVLDFGVAKLLGAHDVPAAATVSLLAPLTPDYASPEQVRGLPVTTACDVYALGVMLYELLCGTRPYEAAGRTVDEILAIVLECEPCRPSASRAPSVPYEVRRLRGDLDAIVGRAMAKDPAGRYGSADDLRDDIARVLAGRPVVARERSRFYVARKAVARHRAVFSLAAVFLVLLVAALVGALWQARIAERERARAEQRFQEVRQLARYVIYDLQDNIAKLAGATELRKSMVQKSLAYLDSLAAEAGGDPALLLEIAGAYHKLGDVLGNPGVANLGDRAGPIASYDKAHAVYRSVLAVQPGHIEARRGFGRLLVTESNFYGVLGQADRARASLTDARSIWGSLVASDPGNEIDLQGLATSEMSAYLRAGGPRSDGSLPHMQRALEIFQRLHDGRPSDPDRMRNLALCHRYLVTFHLRLKEDRVALEHAERAASLDAKRIARDPHDVAAKDDYAVALSQIGVCKRRIGLPEEALRFHGQSLTIRRQLWESDRVNVYARERLMYMLTEIGGLLTSMGRWAEARAHLVEARNHAAALDGNVPDTVPQETLIQAYSHLGRVAAGLRQDPCAWFRKSLAAAPRTPDAIDAFQYRVAVQAAVETAQDGLKSCPP